MKKITKSFLMRATRVAWGNSLKRLAVIGIGIILSCSTSFALQQYCHKAITSGTTTVYLSCQLITTGNYQIKIESDVDMSGLGGCFAKINGANTGYQLNVAGHFTLSADKRTITCDIASNQGPNLYTPLYIMMPLEKVFTWPTDIDWSSSCVIAGIPTLAATTTVTSITTTTAESGGNITAEGNSAVITRGVCWGTATGPTVALTTKTAENIAGTGSFTSSINALSSGIKYYVRSYATNTQGTAYGAEVSFTTADNILPTAFTAVKGAVTTSSVELLLNATDNSGSISYSVSYGSTPTIVTTTGVSGTQKSFIITGLTAGTDYSFSVTAADAAGNAAANNPLVVTATTVAHPVAPVPPTRDASTVIGVYTDSYTSVANTIGPWYGTNSSVDVVTSGNNSKLMTSTGGFGAQFATNQDASLMKTLHVDIYPTTVSTMQIGVVTGPAPNKEAHPANTLVANQWNSFDISLASLKTANGAIDLTKLTQIGFWGMNGTFYLDNIYLWTDVAPSLVVSTAALTIAQPASSTNTFDITTTSSWTVASDQIWLTPSSASGTGNATITLTATAENAAYEPRTANVTILGGGITRTIVVTQAPIMPVAAPVPTVSGLKVMSIYSDTYTNLTTTLQNWSGNSFSTVSLAGNTTLRNTSNCCFGYEFATNPLNISSMTKLHVDIYPLTLPSMTFGITGGGEFKKTGIPLTANQWNSIDVLLSELTGANLAAVAQVGLWNLGGTFYLDNLYLYSDTGTGMTTASVDNGISCYPNPVTDQLTINAKSEISQVVVRNLLGQTVKTVSVNGLQKSIDVSSITAGNYFVSIKLANGQSATQKFVKL